jgi:RNA recognition motif-containing protein
VRKSRGIGFVMFEKDEDAHAAARKLDGKEIAGRTLQIKVQGRAPRMEGPARDAAASPAGSSAVLRPNAALAAPSSPAGPHVFVVLILLDVAPPIRAQALRDR